MLNTRTSDIRPNTQKQRAAFNAARKAEKQYAAQLRKIARHVGEIIRGFPAGSAEVLPELNRVLTQYSRVITPWARATASRMLADVSRRDEAEWVRLARTMARALREEIKTAPTGRILREILDEQVTLITSLPLDAAERVHRLTIEAQQDASRFGEIADMIMQSGQVTVSRANLIARTEVARTASALTQARAKHVGSEGYIWRTSEDSDVRKDHKKLNGRFIKWDDPPIADSRTDARAHAGQIYNCRCYPEVVLPDHID